MVFSTETTKPLCDLVQVLLTGRHSLTPAEREMIATYVSSQNDCIYCQSCARHQACLNRTRCRQPDAGAHRERTSEPTLNWPASLHGAWRFRWTPAHHGDLPRAMILVPLPRLVLPLRHYGIEVIAPHRSNRRIKTRDERRLRRYCRR
jgi:hypothetical protein